MIDKLNYIVEKLVTSDFGWFENTGIVVKDKGEYWMLNYHQFFNKNEYNVLTRGMVVSKRGEIVSCPFFRFFNYGESTAAEINFSNSDVLEKLDGSLVGVFFKNRDVSLPVWHFRSLISSCMKDNNLSIKGFKLDKKDYFLLQEVEPYLSKIEFDNVWSDYCLVFEFISKANSVITHYNSDQYGLYLIGARNLNNFKELSEDGLDVVADDLKVKRPRRWHTNSYEKIVSMMNNFPKDYEGFVVRDRKTGERIKIKNEEYVKRHRLLTKLNIKDLIPLYFDGERSEIEIYHPESKEIFDHIEGSYNDLINESIKVLKYWKEKKCSRKEVALGIIGKERKEVCSVVFKFIDKDLDDNQMFNSVRDFVRSIMLEGKFLEKVAA